MSGGHYGHGYRRETSYVNAGYKQIKQVSRLDWWISFWRILSQILVFALCGLSIWLVYNAYNSRVTWQMIAVYWACAALKHACDFIKGRLSQA